MKKSATAVAVVNETPSTNGNGHSPIVVASSVKIPIAAIVLSQIEPQVRRREHFKQEDLTELGESIRTKGLICPITVRPAPDNIAENTIHKYELVAGERRLLATQLIGFGD